MNDTDSKDTGQSPTPLSIKRECFPCADLCAYRNRGGSDFPCSGCDGRDEFRLRPSIVHAVNAHAGLLEKVAYLDSELVLANAAGAELAAGRDQLRDVLSSIKSDLTHAYSIEDILVRIAKALTGKTKMGQDYQAAIAPPEPGKEAKE